MPALNRNKFSIASSLLSLIILICLIIINYNILDNYNNVDGTTKAFFDVVIFNKY